MTPKKKPTKQYHHGDLRSALVAAAWSLVTKKGLDSLSLRSLADALGVSHAAPAHHFRDKEALLDALRAAAWQRFADVLEAAEPEGLRALGRAYVAFATKHPRQMQLMFRQGTSLTPQTSGQASRAWACLLRTVAIQLGPRRASNDRELNAKALAAWAGVHGLAALSTEVTLPLAVAGRSAKFMRERVLDVVLAGVDQA